MVTFEMSKVFSIFLLIRLLPMNEREIMLLSIYTEFSLLKQFFEYFHDHTWILEVILEYLNSTFKCDMYGKCFRYRCLKVSPRLPQTFMIFPLHWWTVMADNAQHVFSNLFIHRRLNKTEDYCFVRMISERK